MEGPAARPPRELIAKRNRPHHHGACSFLPALLSVRLTRVLAVAVRGFMPVGVMHCLAVELRPVIRRVLAARGRRSVVALPVIQMMVYMTVKTRRSMEPGSSSDKYAPCKPFRAVISVRRARIWRFLIVPVRANGWRANLHGYLRGGPVRCRKKQAGSKSR